MFVFTKEQNLKDLTSFEKSQSSQQVKNHRPGERVLIAKFSSDVASHVEIRMILDFVLKKDAAPGFGYHFVS